MNSFLALTIAILLEVCGTMLLPVTQNFTKITPTIVMAFCYGGAFYFLTFAVQTIPLAVVYATWSGLGIFLIALLGFVIFHHILTWQALLGMVFIVIGVTLVNAFNTPQA